MKRLAIALFALIFLTVPAGAELCKVCRGRMYTTDVGKCVVCGGGTSSGAFKLCRACSARLGQCEHCRALRKSAKIDLHKSGVYTSGKWRYEYIIRGRRSKSEWRSGKLTYAAKPIPNAKMFDRIRTPWGMMQYFGELRRDWGSHGWLLKRYYDQPIDPKKGRLLPNPAERQERIIASYKRSLQDCVRKKGLRLQLHYYGEQGKPFYQLMLAQKDRPRGGPPLSPFYLHQVIGERQAYKIIDHLEESGYLESADYWGRYVRAWRPPTGPCYVLHVPDFHGNLGWALPMLKRLDALRVVLDGDAAKKMDILLGRLSGLRKAWTEADKKAKR